MPLLKKAIVPVGTFLVRTPTGTQSVQFDKPKLQLMAATTNTMIAAGLRSPMPFGHRKDIVPIEMNMSSNYTPDKNNGYWDSYAVEEEAGIPTLFGYSNLDGSDKDKDSAYYKAKHQCKEVSVSFAETYVDGRGRKWPCGIIHTALVNNPVVPGQSEFQDVPEGSITLSLSTLDCNDISNQQSLLAKAKILLQEAVNLILPADTTVDTVLRDLISIATQMKASRPQEGQEFSPLPVYPISMSNIGDDMKFTKDQADPIIASKVVNPATKQPYTYADFGIVEATPSLELSVLQADLVKKDGIIAQLSNFSKALAGQVHNAVTGTTTSRINSLETSGRINKDVATGLRAQLPFQLSLADDHNFAPHPLDATLSILESLPAPSSHAQPTGGFQIPGVTVPQPYAEPHSNAPLEKSVLDDILAQVEAA